MYILFNKKLISFILENYYPQPRQDDNVLREEELQNLIGKKLHKNTNNLQYKFSYQTNMKCQI